MCIENSFKFILTNYHIWIYTKLSIFVIFQWCSKSFRNIDLSSIDLNMHPRWLLASCTERDLKIIYQFFASKKEIYLIFSCLPYHLIFLSEAFQYQKSVPPYVITHRLAVWFRHVRIVLSIFKNQRTIPVAVWYLVEVEATL